ncbi:MAG TPA: hypothetical protein PKD64_01530 [Pirellulaceae bacterium]|nr:hypothetical protein [Pirellulaceae bacterium]HMO90852.1 hypothetical protein [Pirellulaceae bacterium]HMP68672.1 hypothetical protein [Pirellulaceae bacterium]
MICCTARFLFIARIRKRGHHILETKFVKLENWNRTIFDAANRLPPFHDYEMLAYLVEQAYRLCFMHANISKRQG